MSSKAGGKGGGGGAARSRKLAKAGTAEQKTEEVLQAVIIADSFEDRFKPFTVESPRCLLPLANTPMIEYTLEFLHMNGVQEVFLYCANHQDKVEAYINASRWSLRSGTSPFSTLEFVRVADASSIGDFLRDLDKRSLVNGDFILVHGDLVANISLEALLAKHRARREKNRDACMTIVLRSGGDECHRTKPQGTKPIFLIDSNNGRCLHYEETKPGQSDHHMLLDLPSLDGGTDFDVRTDLIDCGVDICTPDVLALWSESFDYLLPRHQFLHGVLKDFELNGKLVHAEIIEEGYAVRATNLQMYDSLSRDILGRWTYPMVPESNLIPDQTYKSGKGRSSLEDGASVDLDSRLSRSVIGADTSIAAGSTIINSIIGRRCRIGRNVKLVNSFLWDDVVVADGSEVSRSILAGFVEIGRNCVIPEGSLLSFNTGLEDGIRLPAKPAPIISVLAHDGQTVERDASLVGSGGRGALYQYPEADDDDGAHGVTSLLQRSLIYSAADLNLSSSIISTLASEDEFNEDDLRSQPDSLTTGDSNFGRDRLSSFASDDSALASNKLGVFHEDAVHGLLDTLRADHIDDFDSAKLEFMGLRLSHDASDHAMQKAIATAFVTRVAELSSPAGSLEPTKAAAQALTSKRGAAKFVKEVGVGGGEVSNQVDFTLALQKALIAIEGMEAVRAGKLLAALLQHLYNLDALEEDGIVAWWADKRATTGESMARSKEQCRVLVEWLENADEEDSSEEEED